MTLGDLLGDTRRLVVLAYGLPPESMTRRQGRVWTQEHELLAVVAERVEAWGRSHALLLLGLGGVKKHDLPDFGDSLHFDHPDRGDAKAEPTPKRNSTPDERVRFFAGLRG